MTEATAPMFEVVQVKPDPLADEVREIFPGASREQVLRVQELVAAEAERIARPPERMGAFK